MERTRAKHLLSYVREAPGGRLGREAALRRDWSREDLRRRARLNADLFAGRGTPILIDLCPPLKPKGGLSGPPRLMKLSFAAAL